MKSLRCLAVGKLKTSCWVQAAGHYAVLLGRYVTLEQITVKDAPGYLPPESKNQSEAKALLARVGPGDLLLGMDARGRGYSSVEFAAKLREWLEHPQLRPCFLLGGAFGLSSELRGRCDELISLSPMTLPHELARVVLLEQLYRAMTILRKTPYHH